MGPTSSRLRLAAVALLLWLAALPGIAQQSLPDTQAPSPTAVRGRADRTPSEQKLDSMLMYAVRAFAPTQGRIPQALQPHVQSFIDANVATDQTLFVVIKADVSPDLVALLRVAGAYDVSEFPQYGTITARVPITVLPSLAQRTDVRAISQQQRYRVNRTEDLAPNQLGTQPSPIVKTANTGAVVWEGVTAHQADKAIATGFDGTGVKVCVLADGVTSLASRQATGDLPATVDVLTGQAGIGDTGTAMLEVIHDMAPGAALGFATTIPSTVQFAANINGLRTAGCNVIVDGFYSAYFDEAVFQDDLVAQAINTATAAGAVYVSAARDLGNLAHGTSGTYEGDFVASAAPVPPAITGGESGATVVLHSFGANPYTTLTATAQFVTLKWSDPLGTPTTGSANDYDLFVLDPSGALLGQSISAQSGNPGQDPYEEAHCATCPFPIGSRIYIVQFDGAARALHLDTNGGRISDGTNGSTFGHSAAESAITVGAIDVRPVGGAAFTGGTSIHVDAASSDGPRRMFINANGTEITPNNVLFGANGGTLVPKVDLAAADCGSTAAAAGSPYTPFCGTAAAASSAAALAALIKSAKPTATKADITTGALDIESAGMDNVSGVGIPMAAAAVRSALLPLTVPTKSFAPNAIAAGAPTALTIAVRNPNPVKLQGMAFIDTYPTNVINGASPSPGVSGPAGCAGTFAAVPGGGTFGVTLATIPANATCTFTVAVTSYAGGNYSDSTGAPTTPIGLDTPPATVPAATLTVSPALLPTLVSVVSRKMHAADTFDLPLSPFATSPTTEPRTGPNHQLVFTFDRVISAATMTVTEGTATASAQPISGTDNNVIVDLTGVPDQQYVTVSLTDVASTDGTSGGSGSARVGFLLGDVNQNRVVTVGDMVLINAQLGHSVSPANFLTDVNANGLLAVSDLVVTNLNLGKGLAAP